MFCTQPQLLITYLILGSKILHFWIFTFENILGFETAHVLERDTVIKDVLSIGFIFMVHGTSYFQFQKLVLNFKYTNIGGK